MYWQKRFDRENPDKQLEDEITKIHRKQGLRLQTGIELRNRKIFVNKKESSKNHFKNCVSGVIIYSKKSQICVRIKGNVGEIAPNRINRRLSHLYRIKR